MKTHDLAKELKKIASRADAILISGDAKSSELSAAIDLLASILQQGPNVSLAEAVVAKRSEDIAIGLRVLSSLSRYTKQQWLALVQDYGMTIEQNPRDSARDVLGKVLRYLEAHPEVVRVLGTKTRRKKVDTSELENALTKLLERKDG